MEKLSQEKKKEIINALKERNVNSPCPRCGNTSFTLLDGYFNQTIQGGLKGLALGGPSIPSIVTVCSKCGFLSQHALGTLGLLPKKEGKDE